MQPSFLYIARKIMEWAFFWCYFCVMNIHIPGWDVSYVYRNCISILPLTLPWVVIKGQQVYNIFNWEEQVTQWAIWSGNMCGWLIVTYHPMVYIVYSLIPGVCLLNKRIKLYWPIFAMQDGYPYHTHPVWYYSG